MVLRANFIHDVAQRCASQLTAAGYTFPAGDDRQLLRTYISVKHRRISTRRRVVHKATYSVPAHLVAGEQQLLAKVAAGGDLWPHQSRKISNVAVEDGMLNDYGIQHFHLGTSPDPKHPNLIEGTKELLFAVVKDSDFYALGIYDHSAWSKQSLLDIIQSNWPELMAGHVLKDSAGMKVSGLRHHYTDEEAAQLRKAGVNVITQGPDGSLRIGPGGGVATSGQSMAVTRDLINLEKHIKVIQEEIIDRLNRDGKVRNADLSIQWRGDVPFVVSTPPVVEINLEGLLNIPSL